jgi:acyl-CoA synthetase (AMP-forming)/AMP-acid ligase II
MAETASPTDVIAVHASARPDDIAVVVDGSGGATPSVTTWAELNSTVNRLAHALRSAGAARGDRVAWCGPNSLEVLVVIHAARKAAVTAVPVSYRFNADEMRYVIENSGAVVVIADAEQAPLLESVRESLGSVKAWIGYGGELPDGFTALEDLLDVEPDTEPDTVSADTGGASMIYTSGTTGKPKGALRTRTDPATVLALCQELRWFHPDHVHLTTGPLYHSGPLAFATLAHTAGGKVLVLRKFDADRWVDLVKDHHVTTTFSAPTQLKRIVSLPDERLAQADCSSMVTLIANAAPVPYALKEEVIAKLGDGFLFEVYGSTELGVDCVLAPEDQLRKPGSCGRPAPLVEVRVVRDDGVEAASGEAGELFVRSALAFDGYYHTDEQVTMLPDEGWKSVGDVAYLDDEGYVYICDRKKDMIISGGVNIYPAEIEAVLYQHPAVLDAAVFGIPSDEWGEQVHCVVQAKQGVTLDLDELRAFVEERVAGYMRPRTYEERDELPRTDSGKLLKRLLRSEHWEGRDRAV